MSHDDELELPLFPDVETRPLPPKQPQPPATPSREAAEKRRVAPEPAATELPPRVRRTVEDTQPIAFSMVEPASLAARFLGGLVDLVVLIAVLVVIILGSQRMGAQITFLDWQPLGLFLAAFSYLYWVVPLGFWGQTPGMAIAGTVARSPGDRPLSFRQTSLRWVGALITVGLLGLPLLLALRGASFTDRVSGSATLIHS